MAHCGLSNKHSIDAGVGIIDNFFCGTVKSSLINSDEHEFPVNIRDRIAWLFIEAISPVEINEV